MTQEASGCLLKQGTKGLLLRCRAFVDAGAAMVGMGSAVLAVWVLGLTLWTVVANPERVLVLAPRQGAVSAASYAGARLVSARGAAFVMVADGPRRGFVRALYAGGAWLVLPGVPGGCVSLAEDGLRNR